MPTSDPAGMAMMSAPMKPQQPRLEGWSMWPESISEVATPALALEMSEQRVVVVGGGGGAWGWRGVNAMVVGDSGAWGVAGVDGDDGDWRRRLLSWASWAKLTLAVDEDDVLALRGTVGNILHIVVPLI